MAAGRSGPGYSLIRIPGHFSPLAIRPPAVSPGGAGLRGSAAGPTPDWSDNAPWVRLADVPTAVAAAAGAVDPATGKVYAVGGERDYNQVKSDLTVYDPATGRWSALPALPRHRANPQAAFIGGKLYVTGGSDPLTFGGLPQLDVYNTTSQTWSTGTPVPHAYASAATVVLNGKMYVIGGSDLAGGTCGETDVQVYNPVTDQWSAAADYPIPVAWPNCGISGLIYCAGGVGNLYTSATSAGYVYDPGPNTWTAIPDMPASLWGGSYGAADGKLLVSGGVTDLGTALTNQGYAYDPATSSWSALPNAPEPVYEAGSACGFYTFGGWSAYYYGGANPASATWQLPGYGDCGGQDWLSATPSTVTVAAGQSATVKITVNASAPSVTQPGTYTASFVVSNDTPYGASSVPVTFTVRPPGTWGKLAGTVTGTTCAGTTGALPGATVQVSEGRTTWTLTADTSGGYAVWLHAASKGVSVITSLPGWQPQAATVAVRAGAATTHDVTLKQICG